MSDGSLSHTCGSNGNQNSVATGDGRGLGETEADVERVVGHDVGRCQFCLEQRQSCADVAVGVCALDAPEEQHSRRYSVDSYF